MTSFLKKQMIRTGRPAFHIKARWISIDGPEGRQFFKLDQRGQLIKTDNKIIPHHSIQFEEQEVETSEINQLQQQPQQTQQQNDITTTPTDYYSIELCDNWLDYNSVDLIEFTTGMPDQFEGEMQDGWFQ